MKTSPDAKATWEQIPLRPECQRQPAGTLLPAGVFVDTPPAAEWINSVWFRQWEALAYGSASH